MAGFLEVIKELHETHSPAELNEAMTELVAAVHSIGKQGKLIYTVTVTPRSKKETCQEVVVNDRIDLKLPELPRGDTLFFANDAGEISRNRLEQPELPFKSVDSKKKKPNEQSA